MAFFRFGLLVIALELASGAKAGDEKVVKGTEAIQGRWVLSTSTWNGRTMRLPPGEQMVIRFDKGHYTMSEINQNDVFIASEGDFRLDPNRTPCQIDLKSELPGPNSRLGVYRIEGDTLTVCFAHWGEKRRPANFEAEARSNLMRLVYERAKP